MKALRSYFYRGAAWAGIINRNAEMVLAARCGDTEAVKALLGAGADVHTRNDQALRDAAGYGNTDTVKALLEAGAYVHAGDDEAVQVAALNGHDDTVKVLQDWMAEEQADELIGQIPELQYKPKPKAGPPIPAPE